MIKKVKKIFKWVKAKREKRPVRFMIIGYVMIWLVLSLVLTVLLGRYHMNLAARNMESKWSKAFLEATQEMEKETDKPDFYFRDNRTFFTCYLTRLQEILGYSDHTSAPYGLFQAQLMDINEVSQKYYAHIGREQFPEYWLNEKTNSPEEDLALGIVDLRNSDVAVLEYITKSTDEWGRKHWDTHYATCPIQYYDKVFEEIDRLRAQGKVVSDSTKSRLEEVREEVEQDQTSYSWYSFSTTDEGMRKGYPVQTVEFYVNDKHEFIPKTVKIWYKEPEDNKFTEKTIDCYEGDAPDGDEFQKTYELKKEVSSTNLSPRSTYLCRLLTEVEFFREGAENYYECLPELYWDRMARALYLDVDDSSRLSADLIEPRWGTGRKPTDYFAVWYTKELEPNCALDFSNNSFSYLMNINKGTYDGEHPKHGISKPFSFFHGDLYVNYYNIVRNTYTGERMQIIVSCVVPGALAGEAKAFFLSMIWLYLVSFLFFAWLARINYKRFYSAQAKNNFYKSLVNSMAHDLKTPLMVMQGYCENLKENVRSEKKDYYADQVLNNIQYLNTLMDKNLYHSRKREALEQGSFAETTPIYLSQLVTDAVERNRDRLQEKNIAVFFSGETSMMGDRETLSLVVENLIGNAVKYSPENESIEIIGTEYAFIVSNIATLTYGKDLQQLLVPLEMGDESRTAGQGTGLGLSIANGIMQGYGGRLKLSYDKETKRFTCMVKIGRARYRHIRE